MTALGTHTDERFRCDRCGAEDDGECYSTSPGTIVGPPRRGQWSDGNPLHQGWLSIVDLFHGPHYCPECAPVVVRHLDEAIRAFVAVIKLY